MNIILTHERKKPFLLSRCLLGVTSLNCHCCKKWKHSLHHPYNNIKSFHIFKLIFFFPLWRLNTINKVSSHATIRFSNFSHALDLVFLLCSEALSSAWCGGKAFLRGSSTPMKTANPSVSPRGLQHQDKDMCPKSHMNETQTFSEV